jgi:hypothetical protein
MRMNEQRRRLVDAISGREADEQATGVRATPGGPHPLYDDQGEKVDDDEARRLLLGGRSVEDPNAGAGGYREFCARLALGAPEPRDTTSSAGDWCFQLSGGILFQHNRYPRYGFRYTLEEGV